jgi:hypothetical protein
MLTPFLSPPLTSLAAPRHYLSPASAFGRLLLFASAATSLPRAAATRAMPLLTLFRRRCCARWLLRAARADDLLRASDITLRRRLPADAASLQLSDMPNRRAAIVHARYF